MALLPLIQGKEAEHHSAVYGAYLQNQRSVLEWPYKLILYPDISKVRLFNLKEDPYEMHDLADQKASEQIIRQLTQRLAELQEKTGDELDLVEFYPWMEM